MDVKELRIGNNISRRSKPEEILTVDIDLFIKVSRQPFLFNPIQITEEILLKAGFEKQSEGQFSHEYLDGVYFEIDGEFIGHEDENICGDFDECVHIRIPKELHKLQNIVYDLTGKELEINF